MKEKEIAEQCIAYIDKSPTCFQAAENLEKQLLENGFEKLEENKQWNIQCGGKYYVLRNGSAIISFHMSQKEAKGFHIIASHSDSPCFKIKNDPEMDMEGKYRKLNTEKYGGMIVSSWLDRPLSLAGRIVCREGEALESKNICVDRDLLLIPNLAIHMDRKVNEGKEYNAQNDLLPLFGTEGSAGSFETILEECSQKKYSDILGMDLFLYVRQKGCIAGAKEELLIAPRLDDLQCVYSSFLGFLEAVPEEYINIHAVFDNEEVGSQTRQGAASTFLKDVLENIGEAISKTGSAYKNMIAESFLISADNAHALHPNHPEKADPGNRPVLNGGIVIKYHGGQKYTTDAYSEAVMKTICLAAEVPFQTYHNRSDIAGGSTLGNLSTAQVPIASVDIGLPQLAMHSAVETAGTKDCWYLYRASRSFYLK